MFEVRAPVRRPPFFFFSLPPPLASCSAARLPNSNLCAVSAAPKRPLTFALVNGRTATAMFERSVRPEFPFLSANASLTNVLRSLNLHVLSCFKCLFFLIFQVGTYYFGL